MICLRPLLTDHTACIWWIQTGTCLLQYLGHSGSVNSVRFHPTLDVAVSASGDQTCHIWKANISAPQHVENLVCVYMETYEKGCLGDVPVCGYVVVIRHQEHGHTQSCGVSYVFWHLLVL